MKNRILSIIRKVIPYVPELMPLAQTIPGCIIMQQLDYWFEKYPDGFYKFIQPCNHQFYKSGQSWIEETGMTHEQFIRNFEKIGIKYPSKTAFEEATDKFGGKFYCAYTDKRMQLTYWFRNHALLDKALDDLARNIESEKSPQNGGDLPGFMPISGGFSLPSAGNRETRNTVVGETRNTVNRETRNTGNLERPIPVIGESRTTVTGETQSLGVGETGVHESDNCGFKHPAKHRMPNTETGLDLQRQQPQNREGELSGQSESGSRGSGSSFFDDSENLIFPSSILPAEKKAVLRHLAKCDAAFHQPILDEIEGTIRHKALKRGIVPYCAFLVGAVQNELFEPRRGVEVEALRIKERESRERVEESLRQANELAVSQHVDPVVLASLPKHIRERTLLSLQNAQKGAE